MNVIETNNLSKKFGKITALDKINLRIKAGEFIGMLGPNGAGKTTLVKILSGILLVSSGKATICGLDTVKGRQKIKDLIGVVPQEFYLERELTVFQYIKLYAKIRGFGGKRLKSIMEDTLHYIGLYEERNRMVSVLSGGMKRRLNIGLGILHQPQVLFLDEPTLGVDPIGRADIWEIIKKLNRAGTTIFLTTNYIEEAERLCNKVGILRKGKLCAFDTREKLDEKFLKTRQIVIKAIDIKRYIKDFEAIVDQVVYSENNTIELITKSPSLTLKEVIRIVGERCIPVESIQIKDRCLEDIFMGLIKEGI